MDADDVPIKAHQPIVSVTVVISTGERAQRYRVHLWYFEGAIQDFEVSVAVHGKGLGYFPLQNQQYCLDVLRSP